MQYNIKNIFVCVIWIVIFEMISFLTASMTQDNIAGWYATLKAPPLVPPNWIFPIMWSILYVMIACTGYTLWRHRDKADNRRLLGIFAFYMLLNWSWSLVYFGLHWMGIALIEIIAMDILIAVMVVMAMKKERQVYPATLLTICPLLWTLFATYLNAGYWMLN